MKFGLFTYETERFNLINIGDYVQSIAARQFLPRVDLFIERDRLCEYNAEPLKIIMNGWFTHRPNNWPPSDAIDPLFVSFHLNKKVARKLLENPKVVDYFKRHAPIGCRDYDSMRRMQEAGINAFYSGCLTTTLNYNGLLFGEKLERQDKILLVDVLFKDDIAFRAERNKLLLLKDILGGKLKQFNAVRDYVATLIPEEKAAKVKSMTCYFDANSSEEERFAAAEDILRELATAQVVVTSRIHIALPCLALGTPVLFAFGGKLSDPQEFRRLDGVINHMNILIKEEFDTDAPHLKGLRFFTKDQIDWDNPPVNPGTHEPIRKDLAQRCLAFIET